jgi:hypothetical protein
MRRRLAARRTKPPTPCQHCGRGFKPTCKRVAFCSRACWRASAAFAAKCRRHRQQHTGKTRPPPTLEEIAVLCLEIQATRSEEERVARARADWKPAAAVARVHVGPAMTEGGRPWPW